MNIHIQGYTMSKKINKDTQRAVELLKEILKLRELYKVDIEAGTGIGDMSYYEYMFSCSYFKYYKDRDVIVHQNYEPCAKMNLIKMEKFFKDRKDLRGKYIFLTTHPDAVNYDFAHYIPKFTIEAGCNLIGIGEHGHNSYTEHIPYSKEYVDFLSKNKKKGYYVCFNGGLKPNRVLLINELVRLGIHKKGLISLLGVKNKAENNLLTEEYMEEFWTSEHLRYQYPYKFETEFFNTYNFVPDENPISLRGDGSSASAESYDAGIEGAAGGGKAGSYYNKSDAEDYYFNVVSETYPRGLDEEQSASLTEKAHKALFTSPIIMNGDKGALQHIKNLGFQTFPEWFDESYDDMSVSPKKTMFIAAQIEKICSMKISEVHELYVETLPKVLYNQKRIVELVDEWRNKVDYNTWWPLEYNEETLIIYSAHAGDVEGHNRTGEISFFLDEQQKVCINQDLYEL